MISFIFIWEIIHLGFLRNGKWRFNKVYAKPSSFGDRMKVHSSFLTPFNNIGLFKFLDGEQWFNMVYTKPPLVEKQKECTFNCFDSILIIFKYKRQIIGSVGCTLNLWYLRDKRIYIQSSRLLLINILNILIMKRRIMVQ